MSPTCFVLFYFVSIQAPHSSKSIVLAPEGEKPKGVLVNVQNKLDLCGKICVIQGCNAEDVEQDITCLTV